LILEATVLEGTASRVRDPDVMPELARPGGNPREPWRWMSQTVSVLAEFHAPGW
jgi:hypothetical protein